MAPLEKKEGKRGKERERKERRKEGKKKALRPWMWKRVGATSYRT